MRPGKNGSKEGEEGNSFGRVLVGELESCGFDQWRRGEDMERFKI